MKKMICYVDGSWRPSSPNRVGGAAIIVNDNDRKYIILLKIRLLSKGILLIKGINNSNTYIVLNDTIKMNNVIILYINQFLSFILKKIFSDVCSNS